MKKWWIGCSGFFYKHWRDKFYPANVPQRLWFEYYCESFNTVELNVTFYRFPKPEALKRWYHRSPRAFRFSVKAPRLITHYKKFNDAERQARDFYDLVADGLEEKLGCVLFQLPPNLLYSDRALDNIFRTIDPAFVNVLEFRHESWWNEDVFKALRQRDVAFCGISYPGLPDRVVPSKPVMYYRFHGVPQLYLSRYASDDLERIASDLRRSPKAEDVYCYFNNDIDVEAIANARELQQMVSSSSAISRK